MCVDRGEGAAVSMLRCTGQEAVPGGDQPKDLRERAQEETPKNGWERTLCDATLVPGMGPFTTPGVSEMGSVRFHKRD